MLLHGVSIVLNFLGCYFCYRNFFSVKFRKQVHLLWVGALVFALGFILIHIDGVKPNLTMSMCLVFIGILLMNKSGYFYTIILYPIVFIMYMCINIFFSFVFSIVFNIPYKELINSSFWDVIESGVSCLFFFIWFIIIGSKRLADKIRTTTGEYLVLLISVVCILVVLGISQGFMKGDDSLFLHMKGPFAISITILCLLLIAGLRGMSYLKSKDALYKAEKALYDQYLANQEEHIKNIIEADKSIRSFRHDINAHLSALESCIDEKDYDELQNYIDRMKEETQNRKAQSYSGYAAVDTIIAEWHEKALKEGIAWEWKGKLREDLKIELFDLCVLFSNILSNAVEAAEKTEIGGERYIKVSIGSFRGRTSIRVTNTCINSSSQRMNLRTSKVDKENHGFGMKNIKRMVEKYNGEIVYNFKNNVFSIEVTI